MSEFDLKVSEMLKLSYELWKKNKENWSPMDPEHGHKFLLYMVGEMGEVIEIIKKKESYEIMNDSQVREKFVEELSDVMMYFIDALNRYGISAEEFSEVYIKKFNKNMARDYKKEYDELLKDK